ncbi:MAG: TetR/AcrR family transcriptional regulator [Hyphomonadaceae bacterium]
MRRSPEASRENILAAAEMLLTEKGPQSLKLVDVAAEAGVANATVLHHFGSIDGVQTALMERMIRQLVETILDAPFPEGDPAAAQAAALQTLFDTFETRGAARLAAWLVLTGESRRLTLVHQVVEEVIEKRMTRAGVAHGDARNMVLVSVVLAVGVGLFGPSLSELIGLPPERARELAVDLLEARQAAYLETLRAD